MNGRSKLPAKLEIRILQRVVELCGTERAACNRLRVRMFELLKWLDGLEQPPRDVFLAAVDFLIERNDSMPFPDMGNAAAHAETLSYPEAPEA